MSRTLDHRASCNAACSIVLNCVMFWSRPRLSSIATQNCSTRSTVFTKIQMLPKSMYHLFCIAILDKRGLDHNMTQFNTKEQATLQLALCDGLVFIITMWKLSNESSCCLNRSHGSSVPDSFMVLNNTNYIAIQYFTILTQDWRVLL